jgi:hypothetical protein
LFSFKREREGVEREYKIREITEREIAEREEHRFFLLCSVLERERGERWEGLEHRLGRSSFLLLSLKRERGKRLEGLLRGYKVTEIAEGRYSRESTGLGWRRSCFFA